MHSNLLTTYVFWAILRATIDRLPISVPLAAWRWRSFAGAVHPRPVESDCERCGYVHWRRRMKPAYCQVRLDWTGVTDGFVGGCRVYRGTGEAPSTSTFVLVATVQDRAITSCTDTNVVNGTTYWYCVKSYDGAGNTSVRTNLAKAVPAGVATLQHGLLVRFEDQARKQYIDWDFNDVGAKINAKLELTGGQFVSKVTFDVVLWYHDASVSYNMYTALSGFAGTGTYAGTVYKKNGGVQRQVPSHLYDPASADLVTRNVPLFQNIGNTDRNEWRAVITLTVDNPSFNPLSAFDKVPFDTWIRAPAEGTEWHIYDPETGEYADDAVMITNDPQLAGVFLNSALVINDLDWSQPYNGKKVWLVYPDFVDYAKTYRTLFVKNATWYEDGPYNPN